MEAKFTPGPWVATPYGDVMPSGANYLVASCGGKSGNYRNYEANARLIAAAPEMLQALQAISSEFIDPLEPSGPDLELPRDWLFRVREVIAKATGEQDTGRESND